MGKRKRFEVSQEVKFCIVPAHCSTPNDPNKYKCNKNRCELININPSRAGKVSSTMRTVTGHNVTLSPNPMYESAGGTRATDFTNYQYLAGVAEAANARDRKQLQILGSSVRENPGYVDSSRIKLPTNSLNPTYEDINTHTHTHKSDESHRYVPPLPPRLYRFNIL